MKAWQVITHPSTSPTCRKVGPDIKGKLGNYGFLKPTEGNLSAWSKVMEICKTLRAEVYVLQCPSSFKPIKENVRNLRRTFELISRDGIELGLELLISDHFSLVENIFIGYDFAEGNYCLE